MIGIPSTKKEGCKAWQIAVQAVPEIEKKETLFVSFPMSRDPAVLERAHQEGAMQTAKLLDQENPSLFLPWATRRSIPPTVPSEADPEHGIRTVMVSGVPSFCAAAARLGSVWASRGKRSTFFQAPILWRRGWIFGNPGADEIGETDRSRKRTAAGGKLFFQDGGKLRNAGGASDPADRGYSGGRRILFADYCKG